MSRKTPRIRATHVYVTQGTVHSSSRSVKLPAEQPLEIRQHGNVVYSVMRTPGHDIELLHGLLFDDGKIAHLEDLIRASYCAGTNSAGENTYNVLDVALAEQHHDEGDFSAASLTVVPELPHATGMPSLDMIHPRYLNSCGVCGTDKVADVAPTLPQLDPEFSAAQIEAAVSTANVSSAAQAVERMTVVKAATNGQTSGEYSQQTEDTQSTQQLVSREDIHPMNATYKCTGWLLLNYPEDTESRSGLVAVTTIAPTFETITALAKAGVPALVSTKEPSALAVELAQETGMLLMYAPQPDRFFVFSGTLA